MAEVLRDEGHVVDVRVLAAQDLPSFDPSGYDVVVLDFKMPDLNGADILRSVRQRPPRAKIFIVSGKPFIEKILSDEGLLDLVSAIIAKPFSINDLLQRINNA